MRTKEALLLCIFVFLIASCQGNPSVFSSVEVWHDQNGVSPLTARAELTTTSPVKIQVIIQAKTLGEQDFVSYQSPQLSTKHTVIVKGLYEDHDNRVQINVFDEQNNLIETYFHTITTQKITDESPLTVTKKTDALYPIILVRNKMYDLQGNLRWILEINQSDLKIVFPLANDLFALVQRNGSTFKVIDYTGKTLQTYPISNRFHHEIIEKTPGGNFLVATNHPGGKNPMDYIDEIDRETGEVVKSWDLREYFDQNRSRWQQRHPEDWAHHNSIQYDPRDDTLLLSLKLQNIVAKIGYESSQLHWMITPPNDWKEQYQQYRLKPTNFNTTAHNDQDWTYLQHTATVMPTGNILVFDNGAGRPGFTDTPDDHDRKVAGGYVRVVEYGVNAENTTVTKVWEHTSYPKNGSNSRGGSYYYDGIVLEGYGEWGAMTLVNYSTKEVLFHGQLANKGFYRAFPMNWTVYS